VLLYNLVQYPFTISKQLTEELNTPGLPGAGAESLHETITQSG
jgi:hypothetical protein